MEEDNKERLHLVLLNYGLDPESKEFTAHLQPPLDINNLSMLMNNNGKRIKETFNYHPEKLSLELWKTIERRGRMN